MKSRLLALSLCALFISGCSCSRTSYDPSEDVTTSGEPSGSSCVTTDTSSSKEQPKDTSSSIGPIIIPDYEYELVEYNEIKYAKITKINLDTSLEELVIPSTLDDYPVGVIELGVLHDFTSLVSLTTSVASQEFTMSNNISTLFGELSDVPTTLKAITIESPNNYRFYIDGLDSLEEITLSNVDKQFDIRRLANLKKVTLNNVTALSDSFLYQTPALEEITTSGGSFITMFGSLYNADATILYRALCPTSQTSYDSPSGLKEVKPYAFQNCAHLQYISLSEKCTTLSSGVFMYCTGVKAMILAQANYSIQSLFGTIPSSLKTLYILGGTAIANNFLSYNSTITSLTLPDTITSVGMSAFAYCTALSSINLPNVATIGNGAFRGCTATVYTFSSIGYNYGENAFYGSSITSFAMPSGITTLRKGMFANCTSLSSITLNDDLKYIEEGAFEGCTSLSSISFPNLLSIDKNAFKGCTSLTSITLPSTIKTIGESAFEGCTSLTSVNFSSASVSLEKKAFYACSKLGSLSNTGNITKLGNSCFADIKNTITTANFPKASVELQALKGWSSLTTLSIGSVPTYTLGSVFGSQSFSNTYVAEQGYNSYYIPNGLTSLSINLESNIIANYGRGLTSLVYLNLAEGVHTINSNAFYECTSIDHLSLPNSIDRIKNYAFAKLDNCRYVDSHFSYDNEHLLRAVTVEANAFSFKKLEWMVPPTGRDSYLAPNAVIIQQGSTPNPKFYLGCIPQKNYSTNWVSPNSADRMYASYSDTYNSNPGYWHYVNNIPTLWS